MSLKEIKNRNIYLSVQDWPQAPVTTSDDEPQIDGENSSDPQEDFFGMSSAALEHDPVLSRQVNVFRKVYFSQRKNSRQNVTRISPRKTTLCSLSETNFARIKN
jgi:hypothetical protein